MSPDDPLVIHSLAEAYLYLMTLRCSACRSGPVSGEEHRVHHDMERRILTIPTVCGKCGHRQDVHFDTRRVDPGRAFAALGEDQTATINPTDEPSEIIDVAGWLTLFTVIAEAGAKSENPAEARHLKLEAAQCLEEALKFYEADEDLPSADAFFTEATQAQFRRQPRAFSRTRLLDLRAKMPFQLAGGEATRPAPKRRVRRRRWWWPWSK